MLMWGKIIRDADRGHNYFNFKAYMGFNMNECTVSHMGGGAARGINVPWVPVLSACGSCRHGWPAGGIYNGDESRRC